MSRYSHSRSSRLVLLPLAFSGMLLMAACSNLNPIGLLTSTPGVNTAANVQAGKTNTQTIGTTTVTEQKLVRPQAKTINQTSDNNRVRAESVKTVVVNEVPMWVILLLILGWLFPSPGEIGRSIASIFKKPTR